METSGSDGQGVDRADDSPADSFERRPLLPNDLGNLLDALGDADQANLIIAGQIIGIYGLRPHEVGQLIWEDGHLKIRPGGKRNKATRGKKQKNRLVLPFDVPGKRRRRRAVGDAVALRDDSTPQAVRFDHVNQVETQGFKPVGDGIRQQLER